MSVRPNMHVQVESDLETGARSRSPCQLPVRHRSQGQGAKGKRLRDARTGVHHGTASGCAHQKQGTLWGKQIIFLLPYDLLPRFPGLWGKRWLPQIAGSAITQLYFSSNIQAHILGNAQLEHAPVVRYLCFDLISKQTSCGKLAGVNNTGRTVSFMTLRQSTIGHRYDLASHAAAARLRQDLRSHRIENTGI
jgi:hypothetical protein